MRPHEIIGDRFEILHEAGAGGMGTVYGARDLRTGGRVAIKVVRAHHEGAEERFEQEARVLSQLEHPAIVRYIAHGADEAGALYLAMEWLEGEDLATRLARKRLTVAESVALVARAADALAAAHEKGIVHRDIKPSNLFLASGDPAAVKLLDFGVARLRQSRRRMTQLGAAIGTLGYMAPEQARGEAEIEPPADVFSLGCVLFECLTGRAAFLGEHAIAVLAKILLQDAPRASELCPDARGPLEELALRMLAKDPRKRPVDGRAVARQLADLGMAMPVDEMRSSRPWSALTAGEQRVVSVLFVRAPAPRSDTIHGGPMTPDDLVGPTVAALEPRIVNDSLRALAESFSARIEPLLDGSMVVSLAGSGVATDQAATAAACTLALRAHMPDLAMALVTGRAEIRGSLPVGEALDRGAQLLAAPQPASPGEAGRARPVRIDEVTAGLLDTRFDVAGDGAGLLLRGRRRHESTRTLLGKPTPHVGREPEMAMLEAMLESSIAEPVARLALVIAPAGAGKSRLRHELVSAVAQRGSHLDIWVGRGDPMRQFSPFGLLSQVIQEIAGLFDGEPQEVRRKKLRARAGRHLPPEDLARVTEFLGEIVGAPFPDEESVQLRAARQDPRLMGDQIRRAWEDFVEAECAKGPVLVVLEDLHWGDLPTITWMDAALHRCKESPLMVLALARPEVLELFPGLWAEHRPQIVKLGALPRKAAQRLVKSVLGEEVDPALVARLYEQSGGNAFYLEELVRAVAEGKGSSLPGTVLAMVEARLLSVPPDARRILRAASVFGQAFSLEGVAALLGGPAEVAEVRRWVPELVRMELLAPLAGTSPAGEGGFSFRNALVREAAHAMLTESDRELGHRLAADWLEQIENTDSIVLAEHFERGGEPARAVRWYRAAAEQALEGNDFGAAVARAERASRCGANGAELGALRLVQAQSHRWCGELEAAHARAQEASSLLSPGDARWYAAAAEVAFTASHLGDVARLEETGVALLRVASDAAGPAAERAASLVGAFVLAAARVSRALFVAGRHALADELLAACTAAHARLAPPEPTATAWLCCARATRSNFVARDPSGYLDLSIEAAAAFELAGASRDACSQRVGMGYAYLQLGAYVDAERALSDALAVAERMGLAMVAAYTRNNLGWALARQGRLSEARQVEAEAVAAFLARGDKRMEGNSRVYLAFVLAAGGDPSDAEEEARRGVALLDAAPPHRPFALAVLARVLLLRGDTQIALQCARDAMACLDEVGSIEEGESLVRLIFAEALYAAGSYAAAHEAIVIARDRLLARADEIGQPARRESFLRNVPENARTFELASRWPGEETLDSAM